MLFTFIVPEPNVTVTALNTQMVGQSLTLECNVTAVRGITSRVDIIWRRDNGAEELNRTNNISPTMMSGSLMYYTDTYTTPPLNTTDDDRSYECGVVVNFSPPVIVNRSVTLDVMGECVVC